METLWNNITMEQGSFPLGTDSVLLADFFTLLPGMKIADLGSGCGTLGLLACARSVQCRVTGVELDREAHALALRNIAMNRLEDRMESLLGDVREIRSLLPPGSFGCVLSNPPYFPVGSGKIAGPARSEVYLNLQQVCEAAAWLLPSGGRFALVHRPERLCDIFCALRENGMEPKRIQFVRHRAASPVCLVLIEARRNGKPGLSYEPDLIEFNEDGTETERYRAACHRGE